MTKTTKSTAKDNKTNNKIRQLSWGRGVILILFAIAVSLQIFFEKNFGSNGEKNVLSVNDFKTGKKTTKTGNTTITKTTPPTTKITISDIAKSKNGSCQRLCSKRINKILITYPHKESVLSSMLSVLQHTINIAGYLCAVVEVPKPNQLLSPYHNHGKTLNSNISWSDFGDFHFWNDDQSLFELNDINVTSLYTDDPKYAKWLHIHTHRLDEIVSHFEQLEEFTMKQQQEQQHDEGTNNTSGFIWKINLRYYDYRPILETFLQNRQEQEENSVAFPLRKSIPIVWKKGCYYCILDIPLQMRKTIDTVFHNNINNDGRNATIGYFHIRRADSIDACDSSLDKVEQYINCSFNTTSSSGIIEGGKNDGQSIGNITILFSSDELDQNYRDSVRSIVKRQGGMMMSGGGSENNSQQLQFIDLDNILRDHLIDDVQVNGAPEWTLNNNFYLYSLVQHIAEKADFKLTRHLRSCHECDKISDQVQLLPIPAYR